MIYRIKPSDIISLSDLIIQIQEAKITPEMVLIDTETHQMSIEIAPIVLGMSEE